VETRGAIYFPIDQTPSSHSVGGLTAPAVAELQVSFAGVAVARTNCHLFSAL